MGIDPHHHQARAQRGIHQLLLDAHRTLILLQELHPAQLVVALRAQSSPPSAVRIPESGAVVYWQRLLITHLPVRQGQPLSVVEVGHNEAHQEGYAPCGA